MTAKEHPKNRGGGRPKGSPNKATAKCREAIAMIAEDMANDFKDWLSLTADGDQKKGIKPDPKGAADLYLKAIEYHIPKLARTEHVGEGGGPVKVQAIERRIVDPQHSDA